MPGIARKRRDCRRSHRAGRPVSSPAQQEDNRNGDRRPEKTSCSAGRRTACRPQDQSMNCGTWGPAAHHLSGCKTTSMPSVMRPVPSVMDQRLGRAGAANADPIKNAYGRRQTDSPYRTPPQRRRADECVAMEISSSRCNASPPKGRFLRSASQASARQP